MLYNLGNPPFVFGAYTVAPFQVCSIILLEDPRSSRLQLPNNVPVNSTMIYANTTALRSDPGCQAVSVSRRHSIKVAIHGFIGQYGTKYGWQWVEQFCKLERV